ncbi:MAG: CoA-transferase, partial [Gammaproteobacteria bacterium]
GGCFFDSVSSFTMIRGGHLDYTVLGYLEVDQNQNIANYKIPGIRFPGMGGAMDLVVGAKKVIVVGTHLDKTGESKLLKKCSLPLTGMKAVYMVVTDAALFTFKSGKFFLEEVFEPYTVDWVVEHTAGDVLVSDNVKIVKVI